jgi:hypothetical protein
MSSPLPRPRQRPPGIYRAARALRRLAIVVLVLVIVFVGLVAYSAVQIVKDRPQVGQSATTFEPNGTVGLTTSFSLNNPTFFPIQSFGLQFRIVNASGDLLIADSTPVTSIASQSSAVVPVAFYLPLSASDESLLTTDQYLTWEVWGNATYGYLFPVSLGVQTQRSWGAPFENLTFTVGTPTMMGGTLVVPVTLSFANDANFADDGTLEFEVVSSGGATCSSGSFAIDVAPSNSYMGSQNVPVQSGCDPSGGHLNAQYLTDGTSIPLPPEPIP